MPANYERRNFTWVVATGITFVGGALLAWSAAIHLYLYSDYFHHIPTIGPLFLLQGIIGAALALSLVIARSVLLTLAGAGLLIATAIGLLLSASVGLFNYKEHLGAPYTEMSLVVEFVGAAALIVAAGLLANQKQVGPLRS